MFPLMIPEEPPEQLEPPALQGLPTTARELRHGLRSEGSRGHRGVDIFWAFFLGGKYWEYHGISPGFRF